MTFCPFHVGDLVGIDDDRSSYHLYASPHHNDGWSSTAGRDLNAMMVIDAFADVKRNVFLTRVLVPSVGVRWISTCYLARA